MQVDYLYDGSESDPSQIRVGSESDSISLEGQAVQVTDGRRSQATLPPPSKSDGLAGFEPIHAVGQSRGGQIQAMARSESYHTHPAHAHAHARRQVLWIPVPDIPLNTFALDSALQRTLVRCGVEAALRFLSDRPFKVHAHAETQAPPPHRDRKVQAMLCSKPYNGLIRRSRTLSRAAARAWWSVKRDAALGLPLTEVHDPR